MWKTTTPPLTTLLNPTVKALVLSFIDVYVDISAGADPSKFAVSLNA